MEVYKQGEYYTRLLHTDNDGTVTHIITEDVEPVIEQNKRDREAQLSHGHRGEFHRKVASIPVSVYEEAHRLHGIDDDPEALRKWLNEYDNRVFRVYEGQL